MYASPFKVADWIYTFAVVLALPVPVLLIGWKLTLRIVAVLFVTADVMFTLSKNGGVMRYTSWPGLGNRPIMENATKDPIAPESSLPGSPAGVGSKKAGM